MSWTGKRRLALLVVLVSLHLCLPREAETTTDGGESTGAAAAAGGEDGERAAGEEDDIDWADEGEEWGSDGDLGIGDSWEEEGVEAWNAENDDDADDAPVSTISVEAVVGRSVALPCDIEPVTPADRVYMVLWFRESAGKPMYSFDVRGRAFSKAKLWSDEHTFGPRAYFVTVSRPAQLTLDTVIEEDEGAYRCRVDFINSPTRNSIVNLTVIVPPTGVRITKPSKDEITGAVLGPLSEGEDVVLDCYAIGGKPPPTVSWFIGDALVDGVSVEDGRPPGGVSVNRLEVKDVRRRHLDAILRCQASNTKLAQPVEKSVRLDILLRPLSVRLLNKPAHFRADHEYQVTCEAVGSRPRPAFSWYKNSRKIKRTKWLEAGNDTVALSILSLTPGPEDDRQQLKCHAQNPSIESSGIEDVLTMNVLYPPQVSLQLGSSLNPNEIKEGDDVYFECQVRANPREHKIIWRHQGHQLAQNTSAGVIVSGSSLVLQRVRRQQSGDYRCAAANSEGDSTSDQVHLRVQFAPVCASGSGASDLWPILLGGSSGVGPGAGAGGAAAVVVGASLEENLSVQCVVAADPADVSFAWQFSNSGDGFEVPAGRHTSSGNTSTLAYTPRTDHDFGTLSCVGANAIGRQVAPCLFHVVPAGPPSPLSNCTVGNRSADWTEVECTAGFDGGLPQAFLLEAYDARTARLRLNSSAHEAPLFRLTDLTPGASLRLVMYAVNAKGRSKATVLEDVYLWDAEERTESVSAAGGDAVGPLPLLALLLGALLALCSMTLVAAMAARNRRHRHPGSPCRPFAKAPPPPGAPPGSLSPQRLQQAGLQQQQAPKVEVSQGRLVVSYALKAEEGGTDWTGARQGPLVETQRPDILVDEHRLGVGSPELSYPLRHCGGIQKDHGISITNALPADQIMHSPGVFSTNCLNEHLMPENLQAITTIPPDRTSYSLPRRKLSDQASSFGTYELNGSYIEKQLLSNDVPESCV
ncbi:nephrin-like [Hetaerina americana]|uniref:nephrin-like n=1 Tax=Hetaerina americana TaxID=62018 RepID=UPI003A7F473D